MEDFKLGFQKTGS